MPCMVYVSKSLDDTKRLWVMCRYVMSQGYDTDELAPPERLNGAGKAVSRRP